MKPHLPPPVPYTDPPCSIYNRCSAPICPLHDISKAIWYADEPICSKREFSTTEKFIKVQRRIAKKTKRNTDAGFFTKDMLNSIGGVTSKIRGTDPSTGFRVRAAAKRGQI